MRVAVWAFGVLPAMAAIGADVPHFVPPPPGPPTYSEEGELVVSESAGPGVAVPRRDELGFANLALGEGATATASSVYLDGQMGIHQIRHLNDGLAGNSRSWISGGEPSWAEIDLGDVYWIYRVAFASDASRRFTDRAATSFGILTATRRDEERDRVAWEEVVSQEDGSPVCERKEFTFPPMQARWVRIAIEKGESAPVRIDEIEVYGQEASIPPDRIVAREADSAETRGKSEPGPAWEEDELLRYAFLGEEHAWLKTYGRADLAGYLVPYNGRVKEYPRHVGDDRLPLPPISSVPDLDGVLDDPCWSEASRGVARVASPYKFDESPLVDHEVWAGRNGEDLCLAVRTDRLLSGHVAVISSADWNGCGVVAFTQDGLAFNMYDADGKLRQSRPIPSGFNRALTCMEMRIPVSAFPGCEDKGLRIGLGMGGRHTSVLGRPVSFVFSPLSVAQRGPCVGQTYRVRLGVSPTGTRMKVSVDVPGMKTELQLEPGASRILAIPAHLGPIGPEYEFKIAEEGGESYVVNLFRYDPLHRTLTLMEELLERLDKKGLNVEKERGEFDTHRKRHDQLVNAPREGVSGERQAFFDARVAKRRLLFRERDLAQLENVLFVKRHAFEPSHIYTDYTDAPFRPGGAVCVLDVPRDNTGRFEPGRATVTRLFEAGEGIARNPVTDFDRRRVYFGFRPTEEGYYHILGMNTDGSGRTQITDGPFHDYYPCCLSDGDVAFISTRCTSRVFCFRGGASVLFRMRPDGQDIRPLSHASLNEWAPSLMNDGRIIWTRWEYVDKGADFTQTLWAIRPDGTHPELVFGNTIVQPNGYASGREVPGTNEISCTLVSHFGDINGPIALVDINKGRFNPKAITSITPEVPWPGMWPREECFRDPIPLSRDYFLCSHAPRDTFGLYVIDRFGNREVVHLDPSISSMYPTFFRAQTRPPVLPDDPDTGEDEGRFVLADVYRGIEPAVQRGTVKHIRVVEEVRHNIERLSSGEYRKDHAEFLEWYASPVDLVNGPHGWPAYVAKASLGIVPVEKDGSAHFVVPAGKNLYFQALDEQFNEIQRMRSLVQLQPGETRGCIGCHEDRTSAAPSQRPLALRREPDRLRPLPWEGKPLVYEDVVQPVLNAKCVSCHDGKHPSQLDFTANTDDFSIPASYRTLITSGLVHYVDCGWNSGGCEKLDPLTFGSVKSEFWDVMNSGHHGVTLTTDEMLRIKTWTDLNCPLWGDYVNRSERSSQRQRVGLAR